MNSIQQIVSTIITLKYILHSKRAAKQIIPNRDHLWHGSEVSSSRPKIHVLLGCPDPSIWAMNSVDSSSHWNVSRAHGVSVTSQQLSSLPPAKRGRRPRLKNLITQSPIITNQLTALPLAWFWRCFSALTVCPGVSKSIEQAVIAGTCHRPRRPVLEGFTNAATVRSVSCYVQKKKTSRVNKKKNIAQLWSAIRQTQPTPNLPDSGRHLVRIGKGRTERCLQGMPVRSS